jgi:hypothetical protein
MTSLVVMVALAKSWLTKGMFPALEAKDRETLPMSLQS